MNNKITAVEDSRVNGLVAPRDLSPGEGVMIGKQFYVCIAGVASGETFTGYKLGTFLFPKNGTNTFVQGAFVYWDDTNKRMTSTAATNFLVGSSAEVVASGDTEIAVALSGTPVDAGA